MATALVGRGKQDVGVARIEVHLVESGVVRHLQHAAPILAAVGGFVDSALTTAAPQGAVGGHPHDVAVFRVHRNHADMLRGLEAHVGPACASVGRLVDPVAVGYRALVVVFSGTHPHRVRVVRVKGDAPDGVGALVVEQGFERHAVVGGLPDSARGGCDVPLVGVGRMYGEVRNPATREGGSDAAKGQCVKLLGLHCGRKCRNRGDPK